MAKKQKQAKEIKRTKVTVQPATSGITLRLNILGPVVILGFAAVFLFWNLSEKYLWQDEAATAVLSARMLKFGRPLAYDGVNLITNDSAASEDQQTVDQRTHEPKAAVDYYRARGDFKADTSWKYHPWGQFIVTAASLKLLGQTTIAARLPFAAAALATVALLYWFVAARFNVWMASISCLLVVFNSYWILHSRQCRYYSLSSLFVLLTFIAYERWQWGLARWGAPVFVVVAWCWFQVDYGTVWPVFAVLFLDACWATRWKNIWKPLVTGVILAGTVAPFAYYYELWGRLSKQNYTWEERFVANIFNMNEYVVPAIVLGLAMILVVVRWQELPDEERRLVAVTCGILLAFVVWIPTVAPQSFLRYVVPVIPIGALLSAWVLVRGFQLWKPALVWAGAAVLVLTPLAGLPMHSYAAPPDYLKSDSLIRPELSIALSEIFGHRPDPNRMVVDWLKQNAAPTDEIVINYEDVPLMYYLPNPIRGGIPAFRAEDDAKTPPNFLVIRRSVRFVHWPVFQSVRQRYRWTEIPTKAPDIMWGNNPDPLGEVGNPRLAQPLLIYRRAN